MHNILEDKVKETLSKVGIVKNLSRKKFIWQFIKGLIKVRDVRFSEIATELNDSVKDVSNERRIQAFFEKCVLDYDLVAVLLVLFLPKGKVLLSIDRTEWDFGQCQINILVIVARCGNVGVSLYFEMLDNKSGNSNTDDRKAIIRKCISLLEDRGIEAIVMDREFIGHSWLKFLKDNGVDFCVRVPKSHFITLKNEVAFSVEELLSTQKERFYQHIRVDGVWVNLHIKKLAGGDYLFLIGTFAAKQLGDLYRKRWCIETLFQSLKSRGRFAAAIQFRKISSERY